MAHRPCSHHIAAVSPIQCLGRPPAPLIQLHQSFIHGLSQATNSHVHTVSPRVYKIKLTKFDGGPKQFKMFLSSFKILIL